MAAQSFEPFRSEQAQAEYEAYCRERAATWPAPSETRFLDTATGRTFVRITGRAGDPPLVLLPGVRVGSLMWLDGIAELSAHHRTYALDIAGDVGLSVGRYKMSRSDDFVRWLDEVTRVLIPEEPFSLLGVSFGGSIAAQYALRFPERLRRLVLLAPAGSVLPFSFSFFARITALTLPLPGRHGNAFRRTLLWLFEDAARGDERCRQRLESMIAELQMVVRLFALPPPPWPRAFTDEEWRGLSVPCLFVVGENEKIYSARKAIARLRRVAPQVKTEIIPGAGHDLGMAQPDLVGRKILEFLGERGA